MKNLLTSIDRGLARIALFFIFLYQKTLSPDIGLPSLWLKGRVCTHEPHCSEYGKQCFERYGFVRGLHYTISRVSHCLPSTEKQIDPNHYSVVFFSGAPIGVNFLEGLINDKRFEVTGVVSMPDAARGRGQKIQENIVVKKSKELGIAEDDVQTPHSLKLSSKKRGEEARTFYERLKKKKIDYIVVVAYGKIIPQEILDIPRVGPINVHGSLLPAYRGASPLQSVFLYGEKKTGMTIMRMHAQLDAGDSISQKTIDLDFSTTVKNLIDIFNDIGPTYLQNTLWAYGKGRLVATPQDHTNATYTKKITKEDGLIDVDSDTLEMVYRKRKAYILRPKIYFIYKSKRIVIEHIELDESIYMQQKNQPRITSQENGGFALHHAVITLEVKPEGKKKMSWDDFVRGYLI